MSKRLAALLVAGGIVVVAYGVLVEREPHAVESPVHAQPIPAVADPGTAMFAAIRAAEAQTDAVARCRAVPLPRGWVWQEGMEAAFCDDVFTPRKSFDAVESMIDGGKGNELDAHFEALADEFFEERLAEGVYWYGYTGTFRGSSSNLTRLTTAWIEQQPNSAHAQMAAAFHHLARAEEIRGEKPVAQVPREDLASMEAALDLAVDSAERAIALDARSLPAYAVLIEAARLRGNRAAIGKALADGLKQRPDAYFLRTIAMHASWPMWGGSQQEMDALAEAAQAHVASNPRLAALRADALGYAGMMAAHEEDCREAVRRLDAALQNGLHYEWLLQLQSCLSDTGDLARAVEVQTQTQRFSPSMTYARWNRARALIKLDQPDWALAEYEAMAQLGGSSNPAFMQSYVWALNTQRRYDDVARKLGTLHAANPSDRWVNIELAKLHLYRTRALDDAKRYIDALIAADPQDGAAWLLHTDWLQNTNADNDAIKASAENFVKFADTEDEEQRQALPKVQGWLQHAGAGS